MATALAPEAGREIVEPKGSERRLQQKTIVIGICSKAMQINYEELMLCLPIS